MKWCGALAVLVFASLWFGGGRDVQAAKRNKGKRNVTKIIPQKDFTDALIRLAKDEREPVASSTLVEKGRGELYYSVSKMFDNDLETFWAEGAKGGGWHEWVAFQLPDDTTHVEIVPGAGKEQFENFNRPRSLFLDVYLAKLKRDKATDEYKPSFKYMGRTTFKFKNSSDPVRMKVPVKLPEMALAVRTMYVGVLVLKKIYKGQFDDTSIAEIRTSSVWGEL
jgi:hypothetical protein